MMKLDDVHFNMGDDLLYNFPEPLIDVRSYQLSYFVVIRFKIFQ